MENNSTYGQEISIRDWMFSVFHKWKLILMAAIVCALLLGGFKGITGYFQTKDADAINTANETYIKEMEEYEANKSLKQKEIEKIAIDLEAQK